jgi:hypothetical protein
MQTKARKSLAKCLLVVGPTGFLDTKKTQNVHILFGCIAVDVWLHQNVIIIVLSVTMQCSQISHYVVHDFPSAEWRLK